MQNLLISFLFFLSIHPVIAQDKKEIEKLLDFVKVEGGIFTMGNKAVLKSQKKYYIEHSVELSSFYMQTTEVTQELWVAVMKYNYSVNKSSNKLPVTNVCWTECQDFIMKLNKITGKTYRLPTEAEWEYAARGGKLSKNFKYSGSDNIDEVAWIRDNSGIKLQPVGMKKPNELGIYDMSGNVCEFCEDRYGKYNTSFELNPTGPIKGKYRVCRGGCWALFEDFCEVSCRGVGLEHKSDPGTGFRLVISSE